MLTIRERIAAAEAKPHVTAAELALLVGVSVYTIRKLGKLHQLPRLVLGRAVRYPRIEALRAMRLRGVGASSSELESRETADV
jgi:hypothetical protein